MTKVTATQPEREVKPAQDITPGDWIHEGELVDAPGPARVLYVHPYLQDGQRWINVTYEMKPGGQPIAEGIEHGAPVVLASEAEVAEAQKDAERAKFVAEVRAFATWMEERPWAPVPSRFSVMVHLHDAAGIDTVRAVAEHLGVEVDSSEDKTDADVEIGCVEYSVIAWHRKPKPVADPSGLGYSREADDPTPVSPARVPMHTGGMVDGGELVDETPCYVPNGFQAPEVIAEREADCAAGHPDRPCILPSGLTRAADESRGVLAGTTPVVTYFSFGHGQSDPTTGKSLLNHYVTVVAPTYEESREAMFASRFGRAWSFDCLAGTARATEWIPRWTEHEMIVAPGTNEELAEAALEAARGLLPAPVHFDFDDGTSACGLAPTSPHTGAAKWDDVNCTDCFDQAPF